VLKIILSLVISSNLFAVDMKPMNIEPGLWKSETKMDNGGMIKQMLAKVPEAQRAMVKQMMEKSMKKQLPATDVCFTKEMINNPQKVYEEQMAKNTQGCKFNVKESTSTKFSGTMVCKDKNFSSDFVWKVKNKKETESVVNIVSNGGAKQKIHVISKWFKADCKPKKDQ
jgi:hypothetical protein